MSVSVIIPTYNRASTIKDSIQSVLNQTVQPLEIIIIDDHSLDNTEEIVKSFNSSKVIYILNRRTKGANGARNTGINLAKGKYIAFQDSDDIWHHNKLEMQLSFMEKYQSYDMCFCSLEKKNVVENIFPKTEVSEHNIKNEILKKNFISTQTIFIKTEVAKNILFDENLKKLQDWDFCIRVLKKYKIKHINQVMVDVFLQEDSITYIESPVDAYRQIFKKHPQLIESCYRNKALYQKVLLNEKYQERNWWYFIIHLIKFISLRFILKSFKKNEILY